MGAARVYRRLGAVRHETWVDFLRDREGFERLARGEAIKRCGQNDEGRSP